MAAPNPACPSFKKWRGVSARGKQRMRDDAKPPVFTPKFNVYVPAELQDVLSSRPKEYSSDDLTDAFGAIKASDRNQWLPAVTALRKALCADDSRLNDVVEAGVLPRLTAMMGMKDLPQLQLEAAWAVSNVASGTSEQCAAVVEAEAIPPALVLLSAENPSLREQAAWLLGNLVGDGAAVRDKCLDAGLLPALLPAVKKETDAKAVRQYAFLLNNAARFKPRRRSALLELLPALAQLVGSAKDGEVLVDGLWALVHVAEDCVREVALDARHAVSRAAQLLSERSWSQHVTTPAARLLGTLASGHHEVAQVVLDTKVLPGAFKRILEDDCAHAALLREVCFTISNLAAGTQAQAAAVTDAGLLAPLVRVLQTSGSRHEDVRREAAWALSNMACKSLTELDAALLEAGAAGALAEVVEVLGPSEESSDLAAAAAAAEALNTLAKTAAANDTLEAVTDRFLADRVYETLQRAVDGGILDDVALRHVNELLDGFSAGSSS